MQSERKHERETLILQDRSAAIRALCRAAKANNLAEIDKWLELDPYLRLINDGPSTDEYPLFWALESPTPAAFHHLLARGAHTYISYYGHSLAEKIALYCQWPLAEKEAALEALAKKKVVLNPYLLAALKGEESIALSEAGLSAKDDRGNNIAHYASAGGQLALLQRLRLFRPLLIVSMNNHSMDPTPPLSFAVQNGHLEVTQWLLRKGLLLNEGRSHAMKQAYDAALLTAVKGGYLEIAKCLMREGGAQISERAPVGCTALMFAAMDSFLEVERYLSWEEPITRKRGSNIALMFAAQEGHLAVLQWLLSKEVAAPITERDHSDYTALLLAVREGHLAVVRWLLSKESGAKITERDIAKQSALLLATEKGHLEVMKCLILEGGAKITKKITWRDSVLLLAAEKGYLQIIQWLLSDDGGVQITEERDCAGYTALLWAARKGHLEVVKWLLNYGGAKISEQDYKGYSALLWAARMGYLEIVEWLLDEGGAELTKKNRQDETALLLAAEYRQPQVVERLIAGYGADPGDGMEIALKLGAYGDKQIAKAKELVNLFQEYYRYAVNDILLETGSAPDRLLLQELWEIVAEYAGVNNKEQSSRHKQTQLQNESLLKELKTFSTPADSSVEWQELSWELVVKICSKNSYNASTIHKAVKAFLAVNGEKIAGSKLFEILQRILDKTHSLGFPATADSDKEAPKEGKPSAVALPQNLPDRILPPPTTHLDTAAAKNLIQHLKGLPYTQIKDLAWSEGQGGAALVYFEDEEKAKNLITLLKEKNLGLTFHLAAFSSTSSPTARYSLAVTAPNGITFNLPPTANNIATISLPSSSSSIEFFAGEASSLSQQNQPEMKTRAEAKLASSLATRDPLYANPLLDEETHQQSDPTIFSASTTRSSLYVNPLLDEENGPKNNFPQPKISGGP